MKTPPLPHLNQEGKDVNVVDRHILRFVRSIATLVNQTGNPLPLLLAARDPEDPLLPLIFPLLAHHTLALQLQEPLLEQEQNLRHGNPAILHRGEEHRVDAEHLRLRRGRNVHEIARRVGRKQDDFRQLGGALR